MQALLLSALFLAFHPPLAGGREDITVWGEARPAPEPSVVSQQTLGTADIFHLRNLLSNDPMRAIQVLPGVATGDDFRSEFSVRGSGFGHMQFTFDGVPATFLLHTVQQVRDGGSIAMLNGDVLSGITLLNGAYPQRYGNRLGAELDFQMREGARDRTRGRVSISGTDASMVVEGPIGAGGKGSWLASARKSYLDFLLSQITDEEDFGFSFTDAQAKAVYDASAAHRVDVTLVAGSSRLDQSGRSSSRNFLNDGRNAAQLLTAGWRYVRGPSLIVTQRLAFAANQFANRNPAGLELGRGTGVDLTWRGVAIWTARPFEIETGVQLQRQSREVVERRFVTSLRAETREAYDARALWSSAYAQMRRSGRRASMTAGGRVDHWSLTGGATVSPWMQGDVALGRRFRVRAGAGLQHQFPAFEHVSGTRAGRDLKVERAIHFDAGIEHALGAYTRWQATIYNRQEQDLLRLSASEIRLLPEGAIAAVSRTGPWRTAMDGYARGVELLLQRRGPQALAGWLSYSYGRSRYRDRLTGEAFDGDFDQRHTVNAYGLYRVTPRTSVAARFRGGSNVPATGYFEERDGTYLLSAQRNLVRVPQYARLDVRGSRAFSIGRRRLTLFVEIINALDRENARFIRPDVDAGTLQVSGLFESMLPRLPSAGILFEF